ncbi:c-type cytochrome [Alteraurantiacibacter palmitatis]|uniref:C-type cytochrome n=1 Tax=Alteraurantiacibacter palmitatis TaxID=2054628 RepID=A0ABV7E8J5_9SPHN
MTRRASSATLIGAFLAAMAALAQLPAQAQADLSSPPPGEALFAEKCGLCHLEGGFGTRVLARRVPQGQALLQNRASLPAAYTMAVVRRGIGSMPQIRAAELGDAELAAIARYLETGQ